MRTLTEDDPAQAAISHREFAEASRRGERLYVSTIVLCETVWTLRSKPYNLDRASLADFVDRLLEDTLLEIQDRDLVIEALEDYRHGKADFPDYLVGGVNRSAGCRDTLTFDRDLRGHEGFFYLS